MMMQRKNLLCLLLALVMCLGLAACGQGGTQPGAPAGTGGGKAPEETPTPEFAYVAEFKTLDENTKDWINVRYADGDGMYFTRREKVGVREYEDRKPRYDGEFDIYTTFLYFMDNSGKTSKIEGFSTLPLPEDDQNRRDYNASSDVAGICFAGDGRFVTIETQTASWNDGDGKETLYSEEYWENQKYEQNYFIRWFDRDGTELSCSPIEVPQDTWLEAYRMQLDDKGNVVLSDGQGLRAIGPDGKDTYAVRTEDYVEGIVRLRDGRIGAIVYGEQQMLCILDTETGKLKDGVEINFDAYNAVTGNDDYDFFYSNGSSFYGYRIGEEPEKLFSWINCDVNGGNVSILNVDGEGTVTGLTSSYNNKDMSYSFETVTVRKVPYESVPHKDSIRMAVMHLDYRVQDMIVRFNRKNDKLRIEVVDYSEYNNEKDGWDAGQTKLNTEVLSGNVPDIFCLNGLNYTQLASKGILEDLYPYIDADKDMKRADFFPNVLASMEVDGKLCSTVSSFYINSVIGASSVVGDEPGWTYEEFNAALASMPEGCTAFDQYVTRDGILQTCLALDMADFVDWGTGKVNFDSEQFVQLLKFANSFPSEFDWENFDWSQEESTEQRIAQGRQMLVQTSAYSIDDIFYNNYTRFMGGRITYIGYPTAHGTGNMISLAEPGYAMSSKSEHKDEIWQFLREFFSKGYQSEQIYSMPSRIDVFEEKAKEATTVQYQKDADGRFTLDDNGEKIPVVRYSMWNNEKNEVEEIYALQPEQVDQIRALIDTTTKVADYNTEIFDIVSEQAAPFFAGQKSAEEVAKLVQSKANLYVNEQR